MKDQEEQSEKNELSEQIGAKEDRKLRARKKGKTGALYGLGLFGLVGWSVVVPTLLGAALGHWLDKNRPGGASWTLNLLIVGLLIGCLSAWHWIQQEHKAIHQEQEDDE